MGLQCIVFDFIAYPGPKFLIFITKKRSHFFLRLEADFFYPKLSLGLFVCLFIRRLRKLLQEQYYIKITDSGVKHL